ncbi:MAG: helix-turn-helix domain-containing protein [Verrucomicrobia bacterium]|nr:helix-turn-helix domain-containing protein [Verrucomicrobiota bacterium]MCH8526225.1 helix-turn-helix domain-containing protein [Kiritimatiellia bacterium]
MEPYFTLYSRSNVLDLINRRIAEGVFESAERRQCPYMIELRNVMGDDNLCAGVIGLFWSQDDLPAEREPYLPAVNLSNTPGAIPGMGNVLSDDVEVGRMAARHLQERGGTRFLGLGASRTQYSRERLAGFQAQLREKGLDCQTRELESHKPYSEWSPHHYQEFIWEQVSDLILSLPMDTGIFVVSDWLAWPVLRSIERHDPARLQTLGVLGVDNLHGGRFDPRKTMRLSSILPGFRQSGRMALELLMDHVFDGKDLDVVLRSPPETLITRASTAGPACADPILAKIQREIWLRIRNQEPVILGDLARQNGMSPSTFEKKFRATMDKSARETVTDMRIDYAKTLLREKKHPIGEICYLCGYANPASFSNAFKGVTGLPPREWQRG